MRAVAGTRGLAPLLGNPINHDAGARLRHHGVHGLGEDPEDELCSEIPFPVKVVLQKPAEDGADSAAGHGREDYKAHGKLLLVWSPHVGHHAESYRTSGGAKAAEDTGREDGGEVWSEDGGQLPDVHEEQAELQDGLAAELLGPGRPQLAADTVGEEEGGLPVVGHALGHAELLAYARDGVGGRRQCCSSCCTGL